MKYKIKLPIGDWSEDGHGKCEWFILNSSVPVEELREIYFDAKLRNNCSLDGSDWDNMRDFAPCNNYGDSSITREELSRFNITLSEEEIENYINEFNPKDFADVFIKFMTQHNKELELDIVKDHIPTFSFYGYDSNNRHIGYMGYGLFDE